MRLTIFNSILRGNLRPWKNQRTEKYYRQVMTKQFFQPQNSMDEFFAVLKKIFSENPDLLKDEKLTVYLQQPPGKLNFNITEPLIKIELPEPFDITSRFYHYLIKNETTRTTANLFNAITRDLDDTDRHYLINSLRSGVIDKLRDLAEIKSDLQDDQLSAYVLEVLKWSLIRLLLETDKLYPQYVDPIPATDSEIFAEYLSEPVPEELYFKESDLLMELKSLLRGEDEKPPQQPIKVTKRAKSHRIVEEYLRFLSGYNQQQQKIMKDKDYERLLEYTYALIDLDKIPQDIQRIPTINLGNNFIKYTFYLLHKELFTTKRIKSHWITFLKEVFEQFDNTVWDTLKTKFSEKPPYYEQDMEAMRR